MIAMFFTQRVILGKTSFADVPAKLKDQVYELLVDSGLEYFAVEEELVVEEEAEASKTVTEE